YGIARNRNFANNDVYKIVFLQEEKVTNKKKKGFNPEEYKNDPSDYRSNMGEYLPSLNILINAGYWDKRFPKLVPKSMIRRAYQKKHFKLEFIGDISCDIDGSIEMNHRVTSPEEPVYTYDPKKNEHIDGYKAKGVTVLAVDNLPCEMPVESSEYFSKVIRDYIYQLTVNGDKNVTTHPNIPSEIRRSVITQNRKLTRDYRYLERYIS
ncbi:MAG: hypothetical protein HQ594_07295, partial [Candidatus Omnitrophica bacterium]|nr:hypothetical protein [Candidatus Omnitrophota bacterium]